MVAILKPFFSKLSLIRQKSRFSTSAQYWEQRYSTGGNSGRGSYGDLADYKATVINKFVRDHGIDSVIEFGCGDGNQLQLAEYPSYLGLDVSVSCIRHCSNLFAGDSTKSFYLYNSLAFYDHKRIFEVDLALSLDVIYHLVETEMYEAYLHHLFDAAKRFVIIYAWDIEGGSKVHVRHRRFTQFIETNIPGWQLYSLNTDLQKPPQACDFYIYKKL